VDPAFYYWKTQLHLGGYEQQLAKRLGMQALYLRLFDIDLDRQQQPVPVGILRADSLQLPACNIIPVVYITQPCLQHLREEDLPGLAAHISRLIAQLCGTYAIRPAEIQIDCDWTRSTAPVYFGLLRQLRQQDFFLEKTLSCTIRLHQVRFSAASGIPPADRGMLMVYNMGNLTRYGRHNSLLDLNEAKSYLKGTGLYPLPLDIALPVYHWTILFEQQRFKGIVYNVRKADFPASAISIAGGHLYRVCREVRIRGYHFVPGQEVRFEEVSSKDLQDIAAYISPKIRERSLRVAFFHLDSASLRPFGQRELQAILHKFHPIESTGNASTQGKNKSALP